jgi:hypothetical protein
MTADLGSDASSREDRRRRAKIIAKFMVSELGNLDGFVWLDSQNHYRINFPNGWDDFGEE